MKYYYSSCFIFKNHNISWAYYLAYFIVEILKKFFMINNIQLIEEEKLQFI